MWLNALDGVTAAVSGTYFVKNGGPNGVYMYEFINLGGNLVTQNINHI